MDSKIQALADKIYKDGVEKASDEATQIVAQAESQRDALLARANEEAKNIVERAQAERDRLRSQTDKELRVAVENATTALQATIADMVATKAVNKGVDEAMASPDVLYGVVLKMSEQMFKQESNGLVVSTSDAKALEAYFQKYAQQVLSQGVEIREVSGRATEFELTPKNGSYKIEVSEEAFKEYFKEFLRPRLKALLFAETEEKGA